jgi:hypothetical protein
MVLFRTPTRELAFLYEPGFYEHGFVVMMKSLQVTLLFCGPVLCTLPVAVLVSIDSDIQLQMHVRQR